MVKLKKVRSFFVIVLTIIGITTPFVAVRGLTSFQGTVETPDEDPISDVVVVLYDSLLNILGADTTDSNGDYSFSATLSGYSPYYL